MKTVYCIGIALILAATLTGCKNRFETYEPYSTFDEHMAAADTNRSYATEDAYGDQFASTGDDGYGQSGAPARMSGQNAASDQNAEVPFSSSRGSKHAMNIGAS